MASQYAGAMPDPTKEDIPTTGGAVERDSLKDEMRTVVEEARMVIPGVQALFGFQTMAVFNNRFGDLPTSGLMAYLAGLGLLALAIGLLMAAGDAQEAIGVSRAAGSPAARA
jgi:hypothetical protein